MELGILETNYEINLHTDEMHNILSYSVIIFDNIFNTFCYVQRFSILHNFSFCKTSPSD